MQLEEDESKDRFDVDVAVTNPEKVGEAVFLMLSVFKRILLLLFAWFILMLFCEEFIIANYFFVRSETWIPAFNLVLFLFLQAMA